MLGREIVGLLRRSCEVCATDRDECDVTDPAQLRNALAEFRPDAVVHCAAYTAVDRAEGEEAAAMELNGGGTRNVARACRERGCLMVTYGSDYVFDGKASRPYLEDDETHPLSAYGRSKRAAEEALAEEGPEHILIRSQWLFGPHGRNFIATVLGRARRGEALRVVSDQTGCPTHARDLAKATMRLVEAGGRGTFHFSNAGETTWFGLASFVLSRAGLGTGLLSPARTSELKYPAPRPAYSVLGTGKYRRATGDAPRSWEEAVTDFLRETREG